MTDVKLRLSPPWITYINQLEAMFDGDPQIAFNVNNASSEPSVVIATNNAEKAVALQNLLPERKMFGNIGLDITIDCDKPLPNLAFATAKELFETAFSGNPAFSYVVVADGAWFVPFTYVVFKNCVVQFFNDNLHDPHGVMSTLYQEIAEEIFADMSYPNSGGIAYATDVERKVGKSVDSWLMK